MTHVIQERGGAKTKPKGDRMDYDADDLVGIRNSTIDKKNITTTSLIRHSNLP